MLPYSRSQKISYWLGITLICFCAWTVNYIGPSSIDQLLLTFIFGYKGLIRADMELIISLVDYIILYPILLSWCMRNLLLITWQFNWLSVRGINQIKSAAPILCLLCGILGLGYQYKVIEFLSQNLKTTQKHPVDYFKKYYRDPADVTFHLSPHPKSLILIYVESFENSYQHETLFGKDLLKSLTHFKPSISFNEFVQTRGADWTVAGIVASQCGVPLKLISIFPHNAIGIVHHHFLPNAFCLGDVLNTFGYRNIFMNGSSLAFAGDGKFFNAHRYDEIIGREEWLQQGVQPNQLIGWGLPDDLLFQKAKLKLTQLIQNKQLFNLTLLTIDTHGYNGQLNQTCKAQQGKNFEDIVQCTSDEVYDFIKFVKDKGWLDRVAIVVTGDHLAMKNAVSRKLLTNPKRRVFNMLITQPESQKNRETIIHFDLFPTILSALGVSWSGSSHLALGRSAITTGVQDKVNVKWYASINKAIDRKSPRYNQLWLPVAASITQMKR